MGNPWQPILYALAAIFLAMLIVITFPVACRTSCSKKEGFENISSNVTTCPKGTRSFTNMKGNTMCCTGDVEGNFCDGNILCTLSGNVSKDVPTCTALRNSLLASIQEKCPTTVKWKSYYDDDTGQTGCAANVNASRTAPLTPATKYCKIYGNTSDKYEFDSCENIAASLTFNLTFQSVARPNFCIDINAYSGEDKSIVGMATCNGSDGQAFMFDPKTNMVINKQNKRPLYFDNVLELLPVGQINDADPKTQAIQTTQKSGGFTIGNMASGTTMCYGLDPNGNYSDPAKDPNIVIQSYPCDVLKNPNLVWNAVPTSSPRGPVNKPPKGYKWQCNPVPV
jgi:hypothetical protein